MDNKVNFISNVFSDDRYYLKPKELFYFLFNEICSIYTFHGCKINNSIHDVIKAKYSKKPEFKLFVDVDDFMNQKRKVQYSYYVIDKNLILWLFNDGVAIYYKHEDTNPKFEELKDLVSDYILEEKSDVPKFYMIFEEYGGLELKEYKSKIVATDIDTHYNDNFKKVDEKIKSFINNDKTGLVLLHGKSGTGKTSYIRHLINSFDKKFIYLPAELVTGLTKPVFLPFLSAHPNSIYLIEDCEELLTQRTQNSSTNHALLNLLNISDGLIGDGISIKFICIFNSSIKNIDEALLRKGRLVAKYEFKELAMDKANKLVDVENLAIPKFSNPVTLSEIYHFDGVLESKSNRKIGF